MSQRINPFQASIMARTSRDRLLGHSKLCRYMMTTHKTKSHSLPEPNSSNLKKPQNLDPITLHRLKSFQRSYYKRRMVYSTIGVLFGMAGLYLTAIQVPLNPPSASDSPSSNASTVNRLDSDRSEDDPLIILGKKQKILPPASKDGSEEDANFVPTGNSVVPQFPRSLTINHTSSLDSEPTKYQLLGLGIRTVSFLRIQVYVVGIYVASNDIPALKNTITNFTNSLATSPVADQKDDFRFVFREPELSEQIWDTVLEDKVCRMLIRIVPTRNTDFAHLRDAWVRAMTTRAHKAGWRDEKFGESVADFKRFFSRGSIPKGNELLLSRGRQGNLQVWYGDGEEREKLGESKDERLFRAVWLGYLAGKVIACEQARESVATCLSNLVIGRTVTSPTKI